MDKTRNAQSTQNDSAISHKMKKDNHILLQSTFSGIIQAVPYIGGILNEFLFTYRSRIKQERLNNFVEGLIQLLQNIEEKEIDLDYAKTFEFADTFESVLERVTRTSEKEKVEKFHRIIINQLRSPQQREYIETYIDLILKVTEKQFEILWSHYQYDNLYFFNTDEITRLEGDFVDILDRELKSENNPNLLTINNLKDEVEILRKKYHSPESFNIDLTEYQYLLQDLTSKSLMIDVGTGSIGTNPLEIVRITNFGIKFIEHIKCK